MQWSCVTAWTSLFSLRVTPPPPPPTPRHTQIHTHTFTLLCMWDDLDACEGCGLKDRPGREPSENSSAQGIHSHPSMNTRPPHTDAHLHPHSHLPQHFIQPRQVYTFVLLSVTAAALLRVTSPTAAACQRTGWFLLLCCWSWACTAHKQKACQRQTWSATLQRVHNFKLGLWLPKTF